MKLSADSELVLLKVTCSEQEVMIGSGVADPVGLEVTTRASTVSACSSCTSIRVLDVSVAPASASWMMTSCCTELLVLGLFSVASWR